MSARFESTTDSNFVTDAVSTDLHEFLREQREEYERQIREVFAQFPDDCDEEIPNPSVVTPVLQWKKQDESLLPVDSGKDLCRIQLLRIVFYVIFSQKNYSIIIIL